MSLKQTGPNDVSGEGGLSIRIRPSPFRIEYEEANGQLFIVGQDIGASDRGERYMIVYPDSLRNERGPLHLEAISEKQKATILDNIENALKVLRIPFRLQYQPKYQISGARVDCDEGYSLELVGKNQIRFSQGTKSITLEIEPRNDGGVTIEQARIRNWDAPYSDIQLSVVEQGLLWGKISGLLGAIGIQPVELLPFPGQI